jgi:hypothetical protein
MFLESISLRFKVTDWLNPDMGMADRLTVVRFAVKPDAI